MEFGNLGSYKFGIHAFFPYLFAIFEILSNPPILISRVCFKMLLLGVLKLRKPIFCPLVDVSIRFSSLLGFLLNTCGEVNFYFVLFEFVVVLL